MRGNQNPQPVAESIVDRSEVEGFLGGEDLEVGLREELLLGEEVLGEEVILGVDALREKGVGEDLVIGLGAEPFSFDKVGIDHNFIIVVDHRVGSRRDRSLLMPAISLSKSFCSS